MKEPAPKETRSKKILIRIMGVILFVVGLLSAYAHYPIDHPWIMDLGGGLLSCLMVYSPETIVKIGEALSKRL